VIAKVWLCKFRNNVLILKPGSEPDIRTHRLKGLVANAPLYLWTRIVPSCINLFSHDNVYIRKQYIFSCISPTGLATCTYCSDFCSANTCATNFVVHLFCVIHDKGVRLQGYESNRYICISNCWPNLRVRSIYTNSCFHVAPCRMTSRNSNYTDRIHNTILCRFM
jgi:hypothetical protein